MDQRDVDAASKARRIGRQAVFHGTGSSRLREAAHSADRRGGQEQTNFTDRRSARRKDSSLHSGGTKEIRELSCTAGATSFGWSAGSPLDRALHSVRGGRTTHASR